MLFYRGKYPAWEEMGKCLHNRNESKREAVRVYLSRFKVAARYGIWCNFRFVSRYYQEHVNKHPQEKIKNDDIYRNTLLGKRTDSSEEIKIALQNRGLALNAYNKVRALNRQKQIAK